jgi:hypothetical protein
LNAIQQGAEEGGQEAVQQIFSNLTNNQLVESEENIVDWAQGIQPSAEAGGVVGLLIGGLANAKAARKYSKKPATAPEAEVAPEAPIVPPVAPPAAPEVISAQEDEDLAALNEQIDAIEGAPVEEEVVAEEVPAAPIAPLNIDFSKNEGRNVNYQGVQGRIKIDSDGVPYVFTKDGDVVYIEGGLSGQTPQQLGLQPLADDVISETDI